jgi:hypothetical protein
MFNINILFVLFRGLVYSMIEVKKMVEQTKNSKNSAGMVDVAALFDLIEQATQMRDKMRRDFAGLDSRIKKIDTLQYLVSDDGVKLKKNLHYMLVQFLQMNLPEFRFLDRVSTSASEFFFISKLILCNLIRQQYLLPYLATGHYCK